MQACFEGIDSAIRAAESSQRPLVVALPLLPPPRSVTAGPPPRLPDSFETTLHACIADVIESGGAAPAVCHFNRPLDEMDFGQKHCNERCARATGTASPTP